MAPGPEAARSVALEHARENLGIDFDPLDWVLGTAEEAAGWTWDNIGVPVVNGIASFGQAMIDNPLATGLREPLREVITGGLPVLGTCAGLILLAERLRGGSPGQETFGGLDVTVRRNAFGRQTESFETDLAVPALEGPPADGPPVRAAFIRAADRGDLGGRGAARRAAGRPRGRGAAEPGHGSRLPPESTGETRFHELFLRVVRKG
ncbi:hypothetical protein [Brachybacterium sp. Marseille-Q7125]|uniref:hypothetical protein n=1 Tax=Brachybacterium sp. Marseille-Q7125 TaxID=2932815 RepID=UPI001FF52E39|nr:hypothetical protein [Brachybacterium sp. Marseille-Q7125]